MGESRDIKLFSYTNIELTTGSQKDTIWATKHLVLNSSTGELRQGNGSSKWSQLQPLGLPVTVEVTAATTANVTIATALNAGDTIDGKVLAAGDKVLVKSQTSAAETGIYTGGSSPARHTSYDACDDDGGAVVKVLNGTANGGKVFRCTVAAGGTIDSTGITFTAVIGGTLNLGGMGQNTGVATKATPVLADLFLILDSADGYTLKIATGTAVKASFA